MHLAIFSIVDVLTTPQVWVDAVTQNAWDTGILSNPGICVSPTTSDCTCRCCQCIAPYVCHIYATSWWHSVNGSAHSSCKQLCQVQYQSSRFKLCYLTNAFLLSVCVVASWYSAMCSLCWRQEDMIRHTSWVCWKTTDLQILDWHLSGVPSHPFTSLAPRSPRCIKSHICITMFSHVWFAQQKTLWSAF